MKARLGAHLLPVAAKVVIVRMLVKVVRSHAVRAPHGFYVIDGNLVGTEADICPLVRKRPRDALELGIPLPVPLNPYGQHVC